MKQGNEDNSVQLAFGKRIKALRESKEWSIIELSHHMRTDPTSIRRIESGKINSSIKIAHKLAKTFEISMSELFDFKVNPKN